MGFHQGGKDGCCDVVGQVGAHQGRQAGEVVIHQAGDIGFQNISGNQGKILCPGHSLCQHRQQGLVQFHGHHLVCPGAELTGKGANAGADFQHAGAWPSAAGLSNVPWHPVLDQKVLSHGLGEAKAVAAEQCLNILEAA